MLRGVILGVSVALMIVSGYFLAYGIFTGYDSAAFTGSVVGEDGYVSFSIIIFVFSFISSVFVLLAFKRDKTLEYG